MLANHCRANGFGVDILDCEAERMDDETSANLISDISPRVACFVVYGQQPSASTQNMQGAVDTANMLKKVDPSIPILFVGGHVSALPRECCAASHLLIIYVRMKVYTLSAIC